MFLGQFLIELSCKNTHGDTNTHTYRHTHKDSDEYSIVMFCKSTTINIMILMEKAAIFVMCGKK